MVHAFLEYIPLDNHRKPFFSSSEWMVLFDKLRKIVNFWHMIKWRRQRHPSTHILLYAIVLVIDMVVIRSSTLFLNRSYVRLIFDVQYPVYEHKFHANKCQIAHFCDLKKKIGKKTPSNYNHQFILQHKKLKYCFNRKNNSSDDKFFMILYSDNDMGISNLPVVLNNSNFVFRFAKKDNNFFLL